MNKNRIILGGLFGATVIWIGGALVRLYISSSVAGVPSDGTPEAVHVIRAIGLGLLAVLIYALIIPRQGRGISTAVTAGLLTFLAGGVFPPFAALLGGLYPSQAVLIQIVSHAVLIPLAAVAGASLYAEAELTPGQGPDELRVAGEKRTDEARA